MSACHGCAETAVTCRSFLIGCRQVIIFQRQTQGCKVLLAGLVADEADNLTCDSAEEVGAAIHEHWNDVSFFYLGLKNQIRLEHLRICKVNQAVRKQSRHRALQSANIFHRILLLAERSANIGYFQYELTMAHGPVQGWQYEVIT